MRSKQIIFLFVLLALSLGVAAVFAQYYELSQKANVDLNGDGKKESVWVERTDKYKQDYILHIDKYSVQGHLGEGAPENFEIMDIDTRDKYKEVAVHTPGPSDDDEYNIYWYDGGQIREVEQGLGRWPNFTGVGIVYVNDWWDCFWDKTDRYILDEKTHKLIQTKQQYYYVGLNAPVLSSFPIYTTSEAAKQQKGDVAANLRKDSHAIVVLWDPETDCYLIKAEAGVLGWAQYKTMSMMLPSAD